jgi:hypothetical protein
VRLTAMNRRQFLAAGFGAAGALAAGTGLARDVWPLLAREDLVPGTAPTIELTPASWSTTDEEVTFAVLGDNGSGGRQAMAVASRLAETYQMLPFGLVALLGDICYYGRIRTRFADVFTRPMTPLIDAGVGFELAIGNHDKALRHTDASLEEIESELRLLGTPGLHYSKVHGPVELFYLDSSLPGVLGTDSSAQVEWLNDALADSASQWKVVALHHPPFSSGRHGSTPEVARVLRPVLERHHVDLVLSGHDHHYERTRPIGGITYVVSGGGCKTTPVGRSRFTAVAESTLHFLVVQVRGDRLLSTAIRADGSIADHFELRAREGR